MIVKLYKKIDGELHYWEYWTNQDGQSATVHWGKTGERGRNKVIKSDVSSSYQKKIQKELDKLEGYAKIDVEHTLWIEYNVEGMGEVKDVDKRHALEERMQETLGWTGLGNCDGGSIGSGTMEVCCFVVDFDVARKIIEADLKDTEFGDYTKIYDGNA